MTTAIAAFVKTPGVSPVKTRLAASIGKNKAEEIYTKLTNKIKLTLQDSEKQLDIIPIWAVGEKDQVESGYWNNFICMHTSNGCLAKRMSHVYNSLVNKYSQAIIIGSDSPDISINHFKKAIKCINKDKFVFGPTYDGGFYLFGGNKIIPFNIWNKVEYSKNNTLEKLLPYIQQIGQVELIDKLYDVDTVEDLEKVNLTPGI